MNRMFVMKRLFAINRMSVMNRMLSFSFRDAILRMTPGKEETAMNVIKTILNRHSYRGSYSREPVPRRDLITVMEAGLAAPSGCNMQTTSLLAVDDPAILEEFRRIINPPVGETAPAAICVLTRRVNAYRDKCFATQDYSAAIENMLLAMEELGYRSCWYEGHITDDDRICDRMAALLNAPEDYELVCFLPVGIPEEEAKLPRKKAFGERAWFNRFPDPGEPQQLSLLRSTRNTRDLGGYRTTDGRRTRFNRFYRSDKLGSLSKEDTEKLLSKRITTIIDMREEPTAHLVPDLLTIPEAFSVYHCPMNEGAAVPETVEAVPGTYLEIACADNIGRIFRTIAEAKEGVLFHCSAGKDRTGVVAALLLLLCGVDEETVIGDYMLTKLYLWEGFEKLRTGKPIYDLNIVIPRESFMRDFLALFRERFGNISSYFEWLGLNDEEVNALQNKLLDEQE